MAIVAVPKAPPAPPASSKLKFNHVSKKVLTFQATITPTEAEYILNDLNPNNRSLREGVAEQYGHEMKQGRWLLTNQSIGFAKNGALIDGQHRLYGCAFSLTPFDTLVTTGLDEEAREVIDVGLRRSEADVMKLRTGNRVSQSYVGVGRLMMNKGRRGHSTRQDLLDFLERHAKAITFATTLSHPVRLVTIAPVLAAIGRASYTVPEEKLRHFMRILASGIPEPDDKIELIQPILLLRNLLLARKGGRTDELLADLYYKTESVIRAFVDNKPIKRIYAASDELFPLGRG